MGTIVKVFALKNCMGLKKLSIDIHLVYFIRNAVYKDDFGRSLQMKTKKCASLGLRMKFKTLFMRGEEKHGHHFDLPLFFNTSKQLLAPGGLSAECVQVSVM